MGSAGEANRGPGKARNRCGFDACQTDMHLAGEANRGTGKETYNQVCRREGERQRTKCKSSQTTNQADSHAVRQSDSRLVRTTCASNYTL